MLANHLKLKKCCSNCPFLKNGAIELEVGRVDGIINGLLEDDYSTFLCHKTVHNQKTGGLFDGDEGDYQPSGKESMCAGAMIFLLKANRPTVGMRIGIVTDQLNTDELLQQSNKVIDPKK